MKKLAQTVLAFTLAATAGVAVAVKTPMGDAEQWTIEEISDLSNEVSDKISDFGESFSDKMEDRFEQIMSAIAVATKQEAVGAADVSDVTRKSGQQLANAVIVQRQTAVVANAQLDYGATTGQGHDPCGTVAKNKTLDLAFERIAPVAAATVGRLDAAPGRLVTSTSEALQKRLETHRGKFCTKDEAAAGLCSLSDLPGGDLNAALLFEPVPSNSLQGEARKAYMQHVIGEPDQAMHKDSGKTSAGEEYFVQKSRKDAMISVPAYSLAMIDAANTQTSDLDNKSPNEVMKLRVNQYFGGKEAEAWSASLSRQRPRGLLIEAARVHGLEAWMLQKQYEQNQRLEANMAVLLLAAGERLKPEVDAAYSRATTQALNRAIAK